MKKGVLIIFYWLLGFFSLAQTTNQNLQKAFLLFEKDIQLKAAISSLYVVDAKTGKVVFEKNGEIGLAPGSTQKIITSTAAYELLGRDFRYRTDFGMVQKNTETNLYIKPSGDPTLGSWRWKETKEKVVLDQVIQAFRNSTNSFSKIIVQNEGWNYENIPDGWVWQDIGNFYGAGADVLNWRENQLDIILKSGKNIGDQVDIIGTEPNLYSYKLSSLATSAKDTGDNTYIYIALNGGYGVIRGTIPVNRNHYLISGAMPDAKTQLVETLLDSLKNLRSISTHANKKSSKGIFKVLHSEISPPLDSIIYWLNKKSVNLYAEALVKTIGFQKAGIGSTEKGLELITKFWKDKAIDPLEVNILDGSGLSPSNRITTHALVKILQYAKKQTWFNGFYNSLPEINGIKMKSGTIKNVKGFAGYHTSKKGVAYVFCFLVNNYNGPTTTLEQKMYKVLDILK